MQCLKSSSPRPPNNHGLFDYAPATTTTTRTQTTPLPTPNNRSLHNRRRLRRTSSSSSGSRPSNPHTNLNLPLSPHRIIPFFLPLLLSGRAFPISRHLSLDLHSAVELMFCDALFAVRVSLFFDGVEDAAQFGEPLSSLLA